MSTHCSTPLSKCLRTCALLAFCLALLAAALAPVCALAEEDKVVKVGWYDSCYCYFDEFGRRRGVAYEYQREVAAHTG